MFVTFPFPFLQQTLIIMPKLTNAIQKTEVLKWTQELCRCLEAQYRNYSLRYVMDNQNGTDKYLQERATKISEMVSMRVQAYTLLLIRQQEKFTNLLHGVLLLNTLDLI